MRTITLFGSLNVTEYGLCVALGAALWCALTALAARRFRVRADALCALLPCALLLGFACSRLLYVLGSLPYYLEEISQPDKALCFWHGGYSMAGALLGVWLACLLAAKWTRASWRTLADCAAVGAPALVLCERFAERATGLGLGRSIHDAALRQNPFFATVTEEGYCFHTVYRYEAIVAALLLALALWLLLRSQRRAGYAARLLTVLFCASQVLLESLRGDGHMLLGFVRVQQAIYFVALLALAASRIARVAKGERFLGKPLALCCVLLLSFALCVLMEFRVDASRNLWLDYALMALGLAAMGAVCMLGETKATSTK